MTVAEIMADPRMVAELIAAGRRNDEVQARLRPYTVSEWHEVHGWTVISREATEGEAVAWVRYLYDKSEIDGTTVDYRIGYDGPLA